MLGSMLNNDSKIAPMAYCMNLHRNVFFIAKNLEVLFVYIYQGIQFVLFKLLKVSQGILGPFRISSGKPWWISLAKVRTEHVICIRIHGFYLPNEIIMPLTGPAKVPKGPPIDVHITTIPMLVDDEKCKLLKCDPFPLLDFCFRCPWTETSQDLRRIILTVRRMESRVSHEFVLVRRQHPIQRVSHKHEGAVVVQDPLSLPGIQRREVPETIFEHRCGFVDSGNVTAGSRVRYPDEGLLPAGAADLGDVGIDDPVKVIQDREGVGWAGVPRWRHIGTRGFFMTLANVLYAFGFMELA